MQQKFFYVTLIIVLIGMMSTIALPQSYVTKEWEKSDSSFTWFVADNNTRAMAYNPVSDHLLVATRTGAPNVYILDAANGDSLGQLDMTGVGGGTYPINIVRTDDDGVIYVCNLAVPAIGSYVLKIYRWENETATPTVAVEDSVTARAGDVMNVSGTGVNTVLYASGSQNSSIYRYTTTDGINFTEDTPIPLSAAGLARGGISPISTGLSSGVWVNGSGTPVTHVDAAGTNVAQINTGVVSGSWFNVDYIETSAGKKFVAVVGNNSTSLGRQVQIWDVTDDEVNPTWYATVELTNVYNANTNATADVQLLENTDGTLTVYQLVTNNGIARWTVEPSFFNRLWEKSVGSLSFIANDNNMRGLAYNLATDHVLVASRTGAPNVYILDPANGDSLGQLDMTGVSGGTYPINIVKADDDGVIYLCNLALANGVFKIYRWENETAVPTVAVLDTVPGRAGDVINVSGTGVNTVLYASGSGNSSIYRYTTTDGINFTEDTPIPLSAAGLARGGISPIGSGLAAELWVNGSGTPVTHIDASGNNIAQINTGIVSGSWYNVRYVETGAGSKFVAIAGNNSTSLGKQVQMWDITGDEVNPDFYSRAQLSNVYNTNANAAAEIAIKSNPDNTITLFQLITNNGIAAWNVEVPGVVIPTVTIAEIQLTSDSLAGPSPLEGDTVRTSGLVTGVGSQGFFLQDAPGGWNGVYVYTGSVPTVQRGDDITIIAEVDEYYDLTELKNIVSLNINSSGNILPAAEAITTGEYPQEKYEGVLVSVSNAICTNPDLGYGEWEIDDGTGAIRIDDLMYAFVPDSGNAYDVTGCGYFSFDDYKLAPRDSLDVIDVTVPPPAFDTVWELSAAQGNLPGWFDTGDSRRALAYGMVGRNERIYVANHGTSGVVILDAATGDSVGVLNQSGTRVEDVEVSDDGIIFGCNLIAPPFITGDFKVYKWDSETAVREEVIVFNNPNAYRLGDKLTVVGDYSAGTAEVYAAAANSNIVLKWTMSGGTFNATPAEITVTNIASFGSMPSVGPKDFGAVDFYVNGNGINPYEVTSTGDTLGSISGDLVGTGSSAIRYFEAGGTPYVITYQWFNKENARVLDVTAGAAGAVSIGETPTLGTNTNGNGAGDVDFKDNGDGTYTLYVLGTNNGVGAYTMSVNVAIPLFSTTSYDFGVVPVNGSESFDLSIQNIGSADFVVTGVTFQSPHFSTSATLDSGTVIEPDSTLIVPVTYAPLYPDTLTDTMRIYSNVGEYEIYLTGSSYELWPLEWRLMADTAAWMGASANAPRTIAYSLATNHLYFVAHPQGVGDYVKAFDAQTGDFVTDMDLSALVSGGYIKISAIAATEDGQIFASNLSSPGGNFNLYRWADENATMQLVHSAPLTDRNGDILAVSGTGLDVEVYTTGSGGDKIYVFGTTDGNSFVPTDTIPLATADAARYGISRVGDSDYFFINGPFTAPRYIKRDGTEVHVFDTAVVSGTAINYFEVTTTDDTTRRFVSVTNGWHTGPGTKVVELLGEPGDSLCTQLEVLPAGTPAYSTNTNGNATGGAVYSPVNNSLIELITNNGVSSYSFEKVVSNDTLVAIETDLVQIPERFEVSQNYPNPFNPTTTINLSIPELADVKITVYNVLGQKVTEIFNGKLNPGYHKIQFNASRLASGMYFYHVQANQHRTVKRMMLLK
ncbi:MAG: DUF4623 domain-containing protein [Calditrichaeota bacterium]|nr:DUF4623 domain-containing protein [Calditrichota bacterium]RQW07272.1 MAG: DUF4623 domain-containing protein [Calditrichota bacterium]